MSGVVRTGLGESGDVIPPEPHMRIHNILCGLTALLFAVAIVHADGDRLKKFDGSVIVGNLAEFREKSVVIMPEGAAADAVVEVSYRDLNAIKFRHWDGDPKTTRFLIDTRGKGKEAPEQTATIKLRVGKHRIALAYWHKSGPSTLKLEYSGPGLSRTKLSPNQLFHPGPNVQTSKPFEGFDEEGFMKSEEFAPAEKGIFARVHEFSNEVDIEDYADFKGVRVARYAVANTIDLGAFKHTNTHYAVIIHGFVQVPTDGEYTFYLKTSNDTVMWMGLDPGPMHPGSPTLLPEHYSVVGADGGAWWGHLKGWTRDTLEMQIGIGGVDFQIDAAIPYVHEIWTTPAVLKTVKVDRTGEPTDVDSIYAKALEGNTIQRINGTVLGQDGDSLQVEYEGETRKLKMDRIVGVVFQGRRTKELPAQGVLGVSGGIRLPGQLMKGARGQPIIFKAAWGQTMEWPYDRVVRYDVRNGRNTWLTDLAPASTESTPYFDRSLGWSADKSLTGGELKIADKGYPKGLCLHSKTVLNYDLDGKYHQFVSDLGLQHEDGRLGRAVVRVLTDGQVAFENVDLTLQTGKQEVSVDLSGKKTLTLEVDFGENFDVCDHVTFGGAKLVRTGD